MKGVPPWATECLRTTVMPCRMARCGYEHADGCGLSDHACEYVTISRACSAFSSQTSSITSDGVESWIRTRTRRSCTCTMSTSPSPLKSPSWDVTQPSVTCFVPGPAETTLFTKLTSPTIALDCLAK